jgi:hypothetical protein
MVFLTLMHHYLLWHYSAAFAEIFHVWKNLFWFVVHFFSLPQLLRSYFAPFKRMTEGRGETFNFEDIAGFIIINLISRFIGVIIRTFFILLGLIVLGLLCVGIICTYVFWVTAPLVLIGCLYYGLLLLASANY